MICAITPDEDWLTCLGGLPVWEPPSQPSLILAPHPDDETLGAGALIHALCSRGVTMSVVAATDGENAYDTAPVERVRLARLREQEQRDALARLGVPERKIHRLRLPDSGLLKCVDQLTQALLPLVDGETHMIAPWIGDFHPDHVACAQAAEAVRIATGCRLTSYFFWTWHRGTPAGLEGLDLRRFLPGPASLVAKSEALRCHASQLQHEGGEGPILPADLLGPVLWPFEVYFPGEVSVRRDISTRSEVFTPSEVSMPGMEKAAA